MRPYAADTTVAVGRSRTAIEDLLRQHGATEFASGWDVTHDKLQFRLFDRTIRFLLPRPDPTQRKFTHDGRGSKRNTAALAKTIDQADRQRWRARELPALSDLDVRAIHGDVADAAQGRDPRPQSGVSLHDERVPGRQEGAADALRRSGDERVADEQTQQIGALYKDQERLARLYVERASSLAIPTSITLRKTGSNTFTPTPSPLRCGN